MLHKSHKKVTATVRNQGIANVAGKKRKADESFESRPEKYQKTNSTTGKRPRGGARVEIPEPLHNNGSDKAFKFLDLPGEIRNHIYEVIAEMGDRSFPHTYPKRGLTSNGQNQLPPRPLPFIELTQTCVSIRKEFRPMWLSTHRFPLYSLAGYCKAFFPLRVASANSEVRQRLLERYHNPAGTLKIWISEEWRVVTDMIPFLKFRLRFPKYNFQLVSPLPKRESEPEPTHNVSILVNNDNAMWTRYIKQHIITQVLVQGGGQMQGTYRIRIVIKAGHAPDWMKKCVGHSRHDLDTYAERLGLGPIHPRIGFGVDYS